MIFLEHNDQTWTQGKFIIVVGNVYWDLYGFGSGISSMTIH